MSLPDQLQQLRTTFFEQSQAAKTTADIEELRLVYLSRKGKVADCFQQMRTCTPEERPAMGKALNTLKQDMTAELEKLQASLGVAGGPVKDSLDVTLPGRLPNLGRKHPLTQTLEQVLQIFARMGFAAVAGPEIETDYYNFEALNIPKDHPARDMQDTLYLSDELVMRTHTSPMQVRLMEKHQPPIRVVVPGRVFRRDTTDATHFPIFHQVEGLCVDEGVTFGDLKGVLLSFGRELVGQETEIRVRPSFFPFTEPSVECDLSCPFCKKEGCRVCKMTGWIELLGAGMVDPAVFGFVDVDPEKYTGFAFGIGIERLAMLAHGINDIRLFYENDMRFLQQF
jgi:phenylalanyl-tRNA synthetase alpha chain